MKKPADTTVLDPDVFRPRIREAVLKISRFAGTESTVKPILDSLEPSDDGPWGYLMKVLNAARPALLSSRLDAVGKGDWFRYYLDGRNAEYEGHVLRPSEDEDQELDVHYVDLEDYPEESHKALKQKQFVGGYGADVVCLWRTKDGVARVCHAHPEGFWIRAENPVAFVEQFAAQLEAPPVAV
jgi:hypothetical protein